MPSADSGVGSSPTSFLNSLWNSESAAILRNASRKCLLITSFGQLQLERRSLEEISLKLSLKSFDCFRDL